MRLLSPASSGSLPRRLARSMVLPALVLWAGGLAARAQNEPPPKPSVKGGTPPPATNSAPLPEPPGWVKELSSPAPGPHLSLKACEVNYQLGWKNALGAGELKVRLQEHGDNWVGTSTGASTGFARALFSYDCTLASVVDRASLRPEHFGHFDISEGERTDYQVEFRKDRLVTESRYLPKPGKKGAPKYTRRIFRHADTDDLLSAILYVRSQKLEKGDKISRVVQPFNVPYLVTYTVGGKEKRDVKGETFDTTRVDVKIRKVERRTLELSAFDKVKSATLWVSDDEYRLPVEIQAEIFIGYISVRLTERRFLEGREALADSEPPLESLAPEEKTAQADTNPPAKAKATP